MDWPVEEPFTPPPPETPIAEDTTVGLLQIITFARIKLGAIVVEVRLAPDKLVQCRVAIDAMQAKHAFTLKQLQSLIGRLGVPRGMVIPSRAFFINVTICVARPHFHVRLIATAGLI